MSHKKTQIHRWKLFLELSEDQSCQLKMELQDFDVVALEDFTKDDNNDMIG